MLKISCIHTGAGPSIFGILEEEIQKNVDVPYVIRHMTDPAIIRDVSLNNKLTGYAAKELLNMYALCAENDSDIILNVCSSVGEVADAAQEVFAMAGSRIIRIDHRMCQEAVRQYTRICLVSTLESTMNPSRRLLERCAKEAGKRIEIREILVNGAFGLNGSELSDQIINEIEGAGCDSEVLVFAQASMCSCADVISARFGIPVFTSPSFAGVEIGEVVQSILQNR